MKKNSSEINSFSSLLDLSAKVKNDTVTAVTLLTSIDHLPGAETLAFSLSKNQKLITNLILMYTSNVSHYHLKRLQQSRFPNNFKVWPICVPRLHFGSCLNKQKPLGTEIQNEKNFTCIRLECLTKLNLFRIPLPGSLLYLDSDCIVTRDFSKIIEKYEKCIPAFAPDHYPPDRFNAGVMLVRASLPLLEQLLNLASKAHSCNECVLSIQDRESIFACSYDGGDTGLLNNFFNNWCLSGSRLPYAMNVQRSFHSFFKNKSDFSFWQSLNEDPYVIHFSSQPKPWNLKLQQNNFSINKQKCQTVHSVSDIDYAKEQDSLFLLWLRLYCESKLQE